MNNIFIVYLFYNQGLMQSYFPVEEWLFYSGINLRLLTQLKLGRVPGIDKSIRPLFFRSEIKGL
jgi:hypothetical protein